MSNTSNLGLPYILAAQAQKHVTHNEALRALDAIVQLSALESGLTDPPASPAEGDRYLIASPASGIWAGHDNEVAAFQDGAWAFYVPQPGWVAWVADSQSLSVFDGTSWQQAGGGAVNPADLVGVNTTADGTNRLSVKSDAVLFSHDDVTPGNGSVQHKLNKQAQSGTSSVVFQTGFSGRAEFGLTGDDNFHVKVSADGTTWHEAMIVDRQSGAVSLPATAGGSALPNLLINPGFQINQRGFSGGAVAANAFCFDRWKADTGGANVALSGRTLTVSSGKLVQVIEPAMWGFESLASRTFSISVNDPSVNLTVSLGSATGTISAGSGHRSTLLTTGSGDTGNLSFKLSAAAPVTFSRPAIHHAAWPVAYVERTKAEEERLCRTYFERIGTDGAGSVYVSVVGARTPTVATGVLPYGLKRAVPAITASAPTTFDVVGVAIETITSVSFGSAGRSLSEITVALAAGNLVTLSAYQLRLLSTGYIDVNAEI